MLNVVQSKRSVMFLEPLTEVRETKKGQVRHRLWVQRKVQGSLLEGCAPLTKKALRLRSFLKERVGVDLKYLSARISS